MSATILIALLALIFFVQIFTWRRARSEYGWLERGIQRVERHAIATERCGITCQHTLHELTESGSPLMRAIDALPRKRAKKGPQS